MTGMLAETKIKARLKKGEIFRKGTSDPERVVGSKYELRLAGDYLIDPDDYRHYPSGSPLTGKLELKPGDVACVASIESFKMPWNLTATIGFKFSVVRRGVMPLVGSVVDPGYGQHAKDGERLYFLVTNVSNQPVDLEIGKPILVLQFHEHDGVNDKAARAKLAAAHRDGSEFRVAYENERARNPAAGLRFFTDMRLVKESLDALEKRIEWVLLLTCIVVVSALLGTVATILIEILSKQEIGEALDHLDNLWDHKAAAIMLLVVVLAPLAMFFMRVRYRVRGVSPPTTLARRR